MRYAMQGASSLGSFKMIKAHDFYCNYIVELNFRQDDGIIINNAVECCRALAAWINGWMLCPAAEHFCISGGKHYGGKL